jgi:hypothetical protein
MGVVHLAPLGINPGAVTSALAYLDCHQEQFADRHKGSIVESVVLFASHEVVDGEATVDECVFNEYGELRGRHTWRRRDRPNVVDIVRRFIEAEIAPVMPAGGKIYLWSVDPNDFEACFDALADAVLALGRPDATGKHLWANLTGGTNVLNAALFEVASLSGLVAYTYYMFVPEEGDRKYLQPPTGDPARFNCKWVPLTKKAFDEHYYQVLCVLEALGDWCQDTDLLGFLKGDEASGEYFRRVTLEGLRRQFLNRRDGQELERDDPEGHLVRLSEEGQRVLRRIRSPRFQALVQRGQPVEEGERERKRMLDMLKEHELWSKSG